MPAFVTFGRILFAVLFIFSGASKLLDLSATAQMTEKIVFPAALATYTAQLEGLVGMSMPQILAIAAGVLEVVCGFMIALNFGARFCCTADPVCGGRDFLLPRLLESDRRRRQKQSGPCLEKFIDHRRPVHDRRVQPCRQGSGTRLRRLGRALPWRNAHVVGGVENQALAGFEAVTGQNLLWRLTRHAREYRLPAGQADARRQ